MSDGEQAFDYCSFKRKIWDTRVKKSKVSRERIFIALALKRANKGSFFLTPENDELDIAESLARDGLLGHEKSAFFIAHDIYEEWALEKYIDLEFTRKASKATFFDSIGHSLAVRRSFRSWVSEKLLLNDEGVKDFLDDLIEDDEILPCWKDEIIVSILLSNYSESFFEKFENELLSNDLELTKRICFMLRIACKEIDDDLFESLGLKKRLSLPYEHLFTKPKGTGWPSLIKFVSDNIDKIGVENVGFVLPVLNEWNSKFKSGEATRLASLIALEFYKWTCSEDVYISSGETKTKLLNTVVYGATEIKRELSDIFSEVIENKYTEHRDPYVKLCKLVLTKIEGIAVARELPDETIALANLFWLMDYSKDHSYYRRRDERESRYGITNAHELKYHPASAYQTPTYWLLQSNPRKAINFILDFVGKTTENITEFYGKDNFTVAKVVLTDSSVDHYVAANLWGAYRGTGDSPYLLSSILMALEKFFLTHGDSFDHDTLEKWLLYMLNNTNSSAITAVVSSIVQAFPEKTFT